MGVMTIVAVVVMELHKMKITQLTQISGKQTFTEKAKIFGGKKNEDKLD